MVSSYKGKLFCFSPPVMLATFALEICLAAYTIWKYKLNGVSRLVVAMFSLLAIFQLAEYMVCGGLGMSAEGWARVGYVAITLLPPLGLHLVYALAGKRDPLVTGLAYLASAGFMSYFLFGSSAFSGSQCLGNYVIFQITSAAALLYAVYYYGLLFAGIGLALRFAASAKPKPKGALQAFVAGYVLFMLPTTTLNLLSPATIAGIPSIMCGFAVLLAVVMVFWVMPLVGRRRA